MIEVLNQLVDALQTYGDKHRETYLLEGAWNEEITKGDAAIQAGKQTIADLESQAEREECMNEAKQAKQRIKQLAEQASKEAFPLVSMAWMEKFAELILQECFQACMNEGASYEEKAAGAYQSNLYVTAIKQHFGVEE